MKIQFSYKMNSIWLLVLLYCSCSVQVHSLSPRTHNRPTILRRHVLLDLLLWVPMAAVAYEPDIVVVVERPGDKIGLELSNVQIMSKPAVAIQRVVVRSNSKQLLPGMVLKDYESVLQVQERLNEGPYPVKLIFTNLAAGGDAISDGGTPIVTAQDALQVARQGAPTTNAPSYQITILQQQTKDDCSMIQSRRGDVLEIVYQARWQSPDGPIYDSSERRGTGRPYQMVLGSGDMLPGVDLGLYDMCPGEVRALQIPSTLAYGARGNSLYRIPPDVSLYWTVKLVTINSVGVGNARSREDMEERVSY